VVELLDRDLVVVRQKAKLVELTNQYWLQDADGNEIGWIVEEGQSWLRKLLRLVSRLDSMLPHRLGVADASGKRVLHLYKGFSLFRSEVTVSDALEQPIGVIRQNNVFGKIRFSLEGADGAPLGELRAENWRAWDFHIADASGAEVARITKKWAGIMREGFTTADTYVLTVTPAATGPLRSLCFAAAAAIDTALKQNDK